MAAQHGALTMSRSNRSSNQQSGGDATKSTLVEQGIEWITNPRHASIVASVAIVGAGLTYFAYHKWLEEQLANPDRRTFFGRRAIQFMQKSNTVHMRHSIENLKGVLQLPLDESMSIAEIGFGIGDGLQMLSKEFPSNKLIGLDLSHAMVEEAQATLVPKFDGRLQVAQADVCRGLGLAPDSCGLIYNMNCVYFWEDLDAAVQVLRAPLLQGGSCITVMKPACVSKKVTDNFKNRSPAVVGEAFGKAGFQVKLWSQAADGKLTLQTAPSSDSSDASKAAFNAQLLRQTLVIVQAIKEYKE